MNYDPKNASPKVIHLGTLDSSIKPTPPKTVVVSTHVASIMGFAESGPETKEFVDGARLLALYGSGTFDRSKPYFTHSTRLAEIVSGAGNALMFTRIIPEDNDTIANTTIYLDVLKDDVDVLKRNADGSIALDGDGNEIVAETVKGYRIKVIAETNQEDIIDPIGVKMSKQGYMEDADGNKSVMYPVLETRAKYKGAFYNNIGNIFSIPTNDDMSVEILTNNLALPYEFGIVKRANKNATGYNKADLYGSNYNQFAFAPNATGLANMKVDLTSVTKRWYNLTNPLFDLTYPLIEEPYIYQTNLDTILGNIMEVEKAYVNAVVELADGTAASTSGWMDFLPEIDAEDQYRIINPFTASSTRRVPNFTFIIDETDVTLADNHKDAYFSKATPIYLDSGKDGTLTDETFEAGVSRIMEQYIDPNSRVIGMAHNLENIMYDSGYSLTVKEDLVNFIALRKDTFLGLSTRENRLGDKQWASTVEQRAIGVSLKARLALAPESTFFGTGVARAIIVVGSGIDSLDPSSHRYPLLLDIAAKAARMMGGSRWKSALLFDRGERNVIKNYSELEPDFIPEGVKPDLWNIGLIWPQLIDRGIYCFPAMNSVYDIDSSAMGNFFAGIALTVTTKEADAVGRRFNGDMSLSPAEFVEAVEIELNKNLNGKFDGIIKAGAKARITDFDDARGYSYTVNTQLTGSIMKTVMFHYNEMLGN